MSLPTCHQRALLGAALFALSASALAQAGRPPQPRVVTPEVQPDRKVAFRILAPKAEAVRLNAGDAPGGGNAVLKKNDEGVWEVVLGPLEPGAYRYTFSV